MSSDYGTYRLTYTPPNDPNAEYPLITIDMSTPGDANVEQMLRFYEAFLAASGYILKGELQVVDSTAKRESVPFESYDFGDDGFSFVGNPYAGTFANDTISFMGVDVKSFGDSMISSF